MYAALLLTNAYSINNNNKTAVPGLHFFSYAFS